MAAVFAGFALAVIAILLGCLVMVGVQREAPMSGLDSSPPTPLAAFARRVLGLHVFRAPASARPKPAVARPPRTNAKPPMSHLGH